MATNDFVLTDHPDITEGEEAPNGYTQLAPEIPVGDAGTPEVVSDGGSEGTIITINRANLHAEIDRLQREDAEFANAFNSQVGRKAQREYLPKITELEASNTHYQREVAKAAIARMPQGEVFKRIATDPEFARVYTEVTHSSPEDLQQAVAMSRIQVQVEGILDEGVQAGLTHAEADEFRQAMAAGQYDGMPTDQAILKLQRDIYQKAYVRPPVSTPEATPPAAPSASVQVPAAPPLTNPALTSGPDLSPSGTHQANGSKKWTAEQVINMLPDQFEREFPTDDDYNRAVNSGQISGMTPNPMRR